MYDNVDNFAQAVDSDEGGQELKQQQTLVSGLETTISGAKLRYSSMLFLHESSGSLLGDSVKSSSAVGSGRGSKQQGVGSLLMNRLDWLPLPNALTQAGPSLSISNDALRVCPIPPAFAPIPCKPVFYDVALNHLELSREGALSEAVERRCGMSGAITATGGASLPARESSESPGLAQSIYGWLSGST